MPAVCAGAESGGRGHADGTDSGQHTTHLPGEAAPHGEAVLPLWLQGSGPEHDKDGCDTSLGPALGTCLSLWGTLENTQVPINNVNKNLRLFLLLYIVQLSLISQEKI